MYRRRARISILVWLLAALWGVLVPSVPAAAQAAGRVSVLQPTHTMGATKRLALVIGNAAYRNVTPLKNSVNGTWQ
jgi:hypothetical protein